MRMLDICHLRNLVTSLLRRDPRERPSIDSVLRKGFVQKVGVYLESGLPKSVLSCLLSGDRRKKARPSPGQENTSRPGSVRRTRLKSTKLKWRSLPAEPTGVLSGILNCAIISRTFQ